MQNLIIDLETLGTQEDAVILRITAILCETDQPDKIFNYKLSAAKQSSRRVCKETLLWWKGQSRAAQLQSLIPDVIEDVDPLAALNLFSEFLKENEYKKQWAFVWQRGSMDGDWLASLYNDNGWTTDQLPFGWWRVRDIRTAVDVLGQSKKLNGYPDNVDELRSQVEGYVAHDSLSDCKLEKLILRQCGIL